MVKIKQLRLAKKLSQKELAAKVGISMPMISMIECGKRPVSVKTAKKLEPVLGVKWYKLIDDTKETA